MSLESALLAITALLRPVPRSNMLARLEITALPGCLFRLFVLVDTFVVPPDFRLCRVLVPLVFTARTDHLLLPTLPALRDNFARLLPALTARALPVSIVPLLS
jgi:hypothetical protein